MVTGATLRYDEPALVERLTRLAPRARAVFAAACAERMLPAYRWVQRRTGRGDPDRLSEALSALWRDLEEGGVDLKAHLDEAHALVPEEDEDWIDECTYAEHAAAAVAYAIRAQLTEDPQEAAWAARQVYEALDFRVTTRDDIDLNAPGAEQRIVGDPLIQQELTRQQRDLEALSRRADEPTAVAALIRQQAEQAAPEVFDP